MGRGKLEKLPHGKGCTSYFTLWNSTEVKHYSTIQVQHGDKEPMLYNTY